MLFSNYDNICFGAQLLNAKFLCFGVFFTTQINENQRDSGSWTADEQSVCKVVLTDFFLIFNYTVDYSVCSMLEKVTQNLNICLF